MKNLIVPCAGGRKHAGSPLYLHTHPNGMPLLERAIQGLSAENYDRVIFTILEEHDKDFSAAKYISDLFGHALPLEIVTLPHMTSGPAETVYNTIKLANVTGEIAIKDSHNYIRASGPMDGNYIVGLNLEEYSHPIHDLKSKSFIVKNDQGQILDILEKRIRSDVISVGMYGFRNAEDFIMAFDGLNDSNYPINKLYISHLISYLIGCKQRVFHCRAADVYEDWGTAISWANLQNQYATCFIDMDALFGESIESNPHAIEQLRKAADTGMKLIFFTSKPDSMSQEILAELKAHEIDNVQILCGCTQSRIKTVLSSNENLDDIMIGM